jgi:hypothetical protein
MVAWSITRDARESWSMAVQSFVHAAERTADKLRAKSRDDVTYDDWMDLLRSQMLLGTVCALSGDERYSAVADAAFEMIAESVDRHTSLRGEHEPDA